MGRPQTKSRRKPKKKGWRTAATSDLNELYELSVQEPEAECDLIDQVWKEKRKRLARSIREDFCGTAIVAMEWIKRRPDNTSIGVDLDTSVLEWAKERLPKRLTEEQAKRLTLIEGDVLKTTTEPVDSLLAMNFSYNLFKTRKELKHYFRCAYKALVDDGIMLLDAYGGSDSFLEMEEDRDLDGFTYVWDQQYYNPITGDVVNHIHFKFPDGTKIKKAFTYEWRLWTLPEIQELLLEAGFREVTVYWEGTDEETGEGDGEWTATTRGEACPGWVAYLAAEK
ncbi:MAG: methyltransferase domain-containing protein [Phycisphaerales bacterium]|nr:MAG: methyltransferase domain-containing protein [Phycisphaerales bacterium]